MAVWKGTGVIEGDGRPYVMVDKKRLLCGYTTGTCAAAASKMAAMVLLGGIVPNSVEVVTPRGITIEMEVEDLMASKSMASCAVRKDAGDDADATDGVLIYSEVTRRNDGIICVTGGIGVGRVTRKGLDQPVGNHAINSVPRNMIIEAVEDVCNAMGHNDGLDVKIYVPEGERVARKTFNPRLGIEGGISILGTSGIVEPMSETALVNAIRIEMQVRKEAGEGTLLLVPGNYGVAHSESMDGLDGDQAVKCSNFIGQSLDYALELGFKGVLLIGNLGKLVKLGGGLMNTHSRWGDCRMEILASSFIKAGGDAKVAKGILSCISTDDALDMLVEDGLLEGTMERLMDDVMYHLIHRVGDGMEIGVAIFSSKYGRLIETNNVREMIGRVGNVKN